MRQGQSHAEVGIQVQQVPRLVPQPSPGGTQRGDHDHREGGERGRREQHAGVGGDQVPELGEDIAVHRARVTGGDQHDMTEQQVERDEARPPVPARQPVLAERALHPRDPGDERHLGQQQVG